MQRCLILLTLLLTLASCLPVTPHPRVSRELVVPEPPEVAYGRAIKATMAVGELIAQQDPQRYLINAQVQGAVTLNVVITPQGTGSVLEVAYQVAPTHVVQGTITLAEDFLTAYQHQR
jgi:hypothetical protein